MTNLQAVYVSSLSVNSQAMPAPETEELTDTALISIDNGVVTLNKAGGAITATIAKPTATTDDYKRLKIVSENAVAHTLAVVGGSFGNGGSGENLATFSGVIGDSLSLFAYQGEWYITGAHQVTIN